MATNNAINNTCSSLTISDLSVSSLVATDGSKKLVSGNLSGDITSSNLTTTLATVNSNVGSFGSATQVGTFTVNAKGLITAASNVTISGVTPGGLAGGDLSGTYPNPTVAKINGNTLGSTTPTSGNALLGDGSQWASTAIPTSITGTANQITVSASTGAVTLSIPQLLTLIGSSPSFRYVNNTAVNGSSIGSLTWTGLDSAAAQAFYSSITTQIVSNTAGAPRGKIFFNVQDATGGSLTNYATIDGSTGTINLLKTVNIALLSASQLVATDSSQNLVSANLSGDVTSSGLTTTIANSAVTNAKIANGTIDLTTKVTGILPGANGGTNNGFMQFSGPTTSLKTYTLPNATTTILTTNSAVTETQGGTNQTTYTLGDILYASAANTLSKLAGNTTSTKKFLRQTGNGSISAAPAWDTVTASDITGAALTKTDDTNVTLTLGGSSSTALLNAASLTLGWTGQLALTRGGSNASLTASNGGIVYSTASAMAILSGTATANKILYSGSSAAPSWSVPTFPVTASATSGKIIVSDGTNWVASTPTFPNASATSGKYIKSDGTNWIASTTTLPDTGTTGKLLRGNGTNYVETTATFADTYTASNLLYSNGSNTVTGLATANNGVLITSGAGVPSISSTLPNAVQDNITRIGTISTVYQNTAQPLFFARYTSNILDVTGDGTDYTLVPDTADKNVTSSFDTSTGVFTAPNTGFYHFSGLVYVSGLTASHTLIVVKANAPSRDYILNSISAVARDSNSNLALPFTIVLPLTATNTISFMITVSNGTKVVDIKGVAPQLTWISGYLED